MTTLYHKLDESVKSRQMTVPAGCEALSRLFSAPGFGGEAGKTLELTAEGREARIAAPPDDIRQGKRHAGKKHLRLVEPDAANLLK